MTFLRLLSHLYPGLFRLLVILAWTAAAALGGAWVMAERIAADEAASDARAGVP